MIEFKRNKLSLDAQAIRRALKPYLIEALEKAEGTLLEIMRQEVQDTTYKGAPGKPEWRDALARHLKRVYRKVTNDYIEYGVGVKYASGSYEEVRAMLITYGSGIRRADGSGFYPIQTWPGSEVWNDELDGKQISTAKTSYQLPIEFNQRGNDWLADSMKRMHVFFNRTLDAAMAAIPSDVFADALRVKEG